MVETRDSVALSMRIAEVNQLRALLRDREEECRRFKSDAERFQLALMQSPGGTDYEDLLAENQRLRDEALEASMVTADYAAAMREARAENKQLRELAGALCPECIDEMESLKAENQRLREALKELARCILRDQENAVDDVINGDTVYLANQAIKESGDESN